MPETPDFDQLARQAISGSDFHIARVAEQLRLVWNARRESDLAKLDAIFDMKDDPSTVRLTAAVAIYGTALRSLDR